MRVNLQPSYILHSRAYRDSSSLLDIFTAEHGRVSLVARASRRQTRKGSNAALLQPFTPLLISFSGRRELRTMVGCEVAGAALRLRQERMYSGLYLNEMLVRLLHNHDPHPRLFAAYGDALESLAGMAPVDSLLRRFEVQLLDELGYSFAFDSDGASGQPVRAQSFYRFDHEVGLICSDETAAPSQSLYRGADLLLMAAGEYSGAAQLTAKRLLRQALAVHLGDAPLRSRELFRQRSSGAVPTATQCTAESARDEQ